MWYVAIELTHGHVSTLALACPVYAQGPVLLAIVCLHHAFVQGINLLVDIVNVFWIDTLSFEAQTVSSAAQNGLMLKASLTGGFLKRPFSFKSDTRRTAHPNAHTHACTFTHAHARARMQAHMPPYVPPHVHVHKCAQPCMHLHIYAGAYM